MSRMLGADVARLRQLAAQFDQAAERLRGQAGSVAEGVRVAAWAGPVAVRFRLEWDSTHSVALRAAAAVLAENALVLRRNAAAQEGASSAGNGTSVVGSGGRTRSAGESKQVMGGVGDDFAVLKAMTPDEHGVRIVKVTGSDGVERYVVYIAGTGGDGNGFDPSRRHTWFDALDSAAGLEGTGTRRYIESRMAAIPDGAEIMLVGYSQGGAHALDIAGGGKYKVTDVVTYGSPKTASVGSQLNGANVLSIEDTWDPVPGSGALSSWEVLSVKRFQENVTALGRRSALGDVETFRGRASTEGSGFHVHGDVRTFTDLGTRFDESQDPRFSGIKESQAKYRGGVVDGPVADRPQGGGGGVSGW